MAGAVGPFPTAVSAPVSPGGTESRPESRALEPSRPRPIDRAADTDEDLARRFLLGEAAVVRWVETTVGRVVRFRGYRVPSEERHDLVQETLLETCQALARPGFAFSHGFEAFVRSIAYRRCVDWLRRRRAQDPIDPALPLHRALGRKHPAVERDVVQCRAHAAHGEAVDAVLEIERGGHAGQHDGELTRFKELLFE